MSIFSLSNLSWIFLISSLFREKVDNLSIAWIYTKKSILESPKLEKPKNGGTCLIDNGESLIKEVASSNTNLSTFLRFDS